MLTVAVPKRNKLPNIIVLTPKDGISFICSTTILVLELIMTSCKFFVIDSLSIMYEGMYKNMHRSFFFS